MNWRKSAEENLRQYRRQKESLDNLRERMAALAMQNRAVKVSQADVTPVQGGGSRYEDALLDNIVERERLRHTYRAVNSLVRLTERGLDDLDARERRVLELCYIERPSGHVEVLMEEMNVEQAQVYRIRNKALYDFTVNQYGLPDY